jgi:hypothetical protein
MDNAALTDTAQALVAPGKNILTRWSGGDQAL